VVFSFNFSIIFIYTIDSLTRIDGDTHFIYTSSLSELQKQYIINISLQPDQINPYV